MLTPDEWKVFFFQITHLGLIVVLLVLATLCLIAAPVLMIVYEDETWRPVILLGLGTVFTRLGQSYSTEFDERYGRVR